jgi:3-deoxy-D-manno-octulosonic-acid transferase
LRLLDLLYGTAFIIGAPVFLSKKKLRASILGRTGKAAPREGDGPCILIHAVSVGEARLAEPLAAALCEAMPGWGIVVSSTTPTGMEVAAKNIPHAGIVRFPLDFSWRVKRFLNAIRPDAIVLLELEIWPNFLREAFRRNIPVIVANGRITCESAQRYKKFAFIMRKYFRGLAHVAAQDEPSAARFRAIGVDAERVSVLGNIKFDSIAPGRDEREEAAARKELRIPEGAPVLVAGSTRENEEKILLEIYKEICDKEQILELVLAPRHPERLPEVRSLLRERGIAFTNKSGLGSGKNGRVVLVDTMGELSRIYRAADVVFVGGSLVPLGGQNMLEPAAAGRAVLFGPYTDNFEEAATLLIEAKGAIRVKDAKDCRETIGRLLDNPAEACRLGDRAIEAIRNSGGATARHVEMIKSVLKK